MTTVDQHDTDSPPGTDRPCCLCKSACGAVAVTGLLLRLTAGIMAGVCLGLVLNRSLRDNRKKPAP